MVRTSRWSRSLGVAPALVCAFLFAACSTSSVPPGDDMRGALSLGDGRTVRIVAVHSGDDLDVSGVSKDNGARVWQWPDVGGANQRWTLHDTADGHLIIKSAHSGKCLDVVGVSREAGAELQQYDCWDGASNQKWNLRGHGDGTYEIVSVNSGQCLDVAGASTDRGARVLQWPCHGGSNQRWRLEEVSPGGGSPGGGAVGGCPAGAERRTVNAYAPASGRTGQWWCTNHFDVNVGGKWTCLGVDGGQCNDDAPGDATVTCARCDSGGGGSVPAATPRYATILYSVWADHFARSLDGAGKPFYQPNGAPFGPHGAYSWWGTPAFGGSIQDYHFMIDDDPERPNDALIDRHADLLHEAGIDFISIDLSNGEQDLIVKATEAVAKRYSQRPLATTPKLALFVHGPESVAFMQSKFYSGKYNDGIWFRYEGKPLILLANADRAIPTGGALDGFTARHTWGLQETTDKWSFKLNTDGSHPGTAFMRDGKPEEMSVAPACQATYMTSPEGRKGRDGGKYFDEQWNYVFAMKPTFVFITGWNEWGAQNQGDDWSPAFVDQFQEEWSSDIEPMRGGHGDAYYQRMKIGIQRFKSL